MKRILSLALCLFLITAVSMASAVTDAVTVQQTTERVVGPGISSGLITSNRSSMVPAARETAGPDTFALYGGPDHPTEGKFQLADENTPDWGDGSGVPNSFGPGAWTPVDNTDLPVYWHVDTFNAENLNGNGAGNHAMWSGVAAGDPLGAGWVHTPGYGNGWNDGLVYESDPVADPSSGEIVNLDFFFNCDTEPWYDFFVVQYDSAGIWTNVFYTHGSNKDASNVFQPPGVQYSSLPSVAIQFSGNDYGGKSYDRIRIRFLVASDGGWSDQDGSYLTHGGAAQVDDIMISSSLGVFTEDFEGSGPYLVRPEKAPFVGDFAEVYPRMSDIDLCRDNLTPVVGFIDYGQAVRNGPAVDGVTFSTGGQTSPGVQYGIVGHWVVNYSGGLTFGQSRLNNDVWSPEILWDLPGPEDDYDDIAGAFFRFSVWGDMPGQGIVWGWNIRSALEGEAFGPWTSGGIYYGFPVWYNTRWDVSALLQSGSERVQIALKVRDYADYFGLPGNESTPAPAYDNVAFYKYRVGGPALTAQRYDLAHDAFPNSGSIDVSSQASRDALDIAFDMTDLVSGSTNTAGDSVAFDAVPIIPGTDITDVRMVWALNTNAVFEDPIRSAPSRTKDEAVVAGAAGTVWTGEVIADSCRDATGAVIANRYFVDLPDADLMYPGDVLHYYIRATDSDGRVSTLPSDISGFGTFGPDATFAREWTVRGLPTMSDAAGAQPSILVINDRDRDAGSADFRTSFQQLGYREGIDYDTFTHQWPYGGVTSIGTSGAHGANADQLRGYHHIFFLGGIFTTGVLSDYDIDLLQQWHALDPGFDGTRNVAYFGDGITTDLVSDPGAGIGYLYNTMGVDWIDANVRDVIDDQTAAIVTPGPAHAGIFGTEFVTFGGCLSPLATDLKTSNFELVLTNEFAQIQPQASASVGHYFTSTSGVPITGSGAGVASVINPTTYGVDITFPYSMLFVYDINTRASGPAARTSLIQEILELFAAGAGSSPVVSTPSARSLELRASPNPFNPATTVTFTVTPGAKGFVKIFNLRGELVRTLHDGEFTEQTFTWEGTDDHGVTVASGVYLVNAESSGRVRTLKVALVK